MALNVPVPDGSNVDLVTLMKRPVTAEEVNEVVHSAAATRFKSIVEYTDEPIVSSDVIGNSHSGVFDGLSTQVLGGNLLKTVTWYDNGWGYANRVVELIHRLAELESRAGSRGPLSERRIPAGPRASPSTASAGSAAPSSAS